MAVNTDRRSPVGLSRLVLFPLVTDDENALEYGEAHNLVKSLMTATRTPTSVNANQSADNQVVEDVIINTGGTLALQLTSINGDDRKVFYGNKLTTGGTSVANKDDLAPYVCAAYMANRRDKLVNLYKVFKTSFSEQAESLQTVQKDSVNFAVTQLQGNYIMTINSGNSVAIRYGVDPEADADFIESWFTDGKFFDEA